MWYSAVGSIVTLILSMLAVPFAAAAQPAGKVWSIGYLIAGSGKSPPEKVISDKVTEVYDGHLLGKKYPVVVREIRISEPRKWDRLMDSYLPASNENAIVFDVEARFTVTSDFGVRKMIGLLKCYLDTFGKWRCSMGQDREDRN